MAENKDPVQQDGEAPPDRALLFELENVAASGRQIVYDVLKSVLAEKGVKMTPIMFSRCCLQPCVKQFLPRLLAVSKKERLSEGKLLTEIERGIDLSFSDGSIKLAAGVESLLAAARKEGVRTGAVSALGAETVKQLAEKLGLGEMGVHALPCSAEDKVFPSADAWLTLAKDISVRPLLCVAVVTSSTACRTALSAGMKCAAVPDAFTAFQDFGGADCVADELSDDAVKEIIGLIQT